MDPTTPEEGLSPSIRATRHALRIYQIEQSMPHFSLEQECEALANQVEVLSNRHKMLCGHLWTARVIPSLTHRRICSRFASILLPTAGRFNQGGIEVVRLFLQNPSIASEFSEGHLRRLCAFLDHLPSFCDVFEKPLEIDPTFLMLFKEELITEHIDSYLLQFAILRAFFLDFQCPVLELLLMHYPKQAYDYLIAKLGSKYKKPLTYLEDDFNLFLDPEKAIFLAPLQEIFSKVPLSPILPFCKRHLCTLNEIISDIIEHSHTSVTLSQIKGYYSAMKTSHILRLIQNDINDNWSRPMKILTRTFHIPCNVQVIEATSPFYLIRKLNHTIYQLEQTHWLMLKANTYTFLCSLNPLFYLEPKDFDAFMKEKLFHKVRGFMIRPISEEVIGHILLRICENQSTFNHQMRHFREKLPLTHEQFMVEILSTLPKEHKERVQEIIDQEFSKITLSANLIQHVLNSFNFQTSVEKLNSITKELLLSLGFESYYPFQIANTLRTLLLCNGLGNFSSWLIEERITTFSGLPLTLALGTLTTIDHHNREEQIALKYNFCLSNPDFYLEKSHGLLRIPKLTKLEVIMPKNNSKEIINAPVTMKDAGRDQSSGQ